MKLLIGVFLCVKIENRSEKQIARCAFDPCRNDMLLIILKYTNAPILKTRRTSLSFARDKRVQLKICILIDIV